MHINLKLFFESGNILIVEDDETSAFLLSEYLRQFNATIIIASSCSQALDKLTNLTDLKLALLDIRLSDGCGKEIARHIKSTLPSTIIIGQTALTQENVSSLEKLGLFNSFLIKPITEKELLEEISKQITTHLKL